MDTSARPQQQVYTLQSLEQVKIAADPLRLQILKYFCEKPRTTKQVASLMGEKPTRLYHHVEALENAGLITLHHTRPNRGTLEKYYLAVARSFRADESLFAPGGNEEDPSWARLGAELMERTARELRKLDGHEGDENLAVLAQVGIHATPPEVEVLQEKVAGWLEELQQLSEEQDGEAKEEERVEWHLALAFFPVAQGNGDPST